MNSSASSSSGGNQSDPLSVADWCARLATTYPRELAVADSHARLTYADLDERSDRLASALIASGVQPGDRVAALLHNGTQFVELLFATAKARAIILPLNWRLSPSELDYIIADATPAMLFFSDGLSDLAEKLANGGTRICVGDQRDATDPYEAFLQTSRDELPPARGQDEWIMLYTSGTTGRPKGCLLDQRGQFIAALSSMSVWRPRPTDRVLLALPLFHVAGIGILFAHMAGGAGTILPPRDASGADVRDLAVDNGCTRLAMAPPSYPAVIEAISSGSAKPDIQYLTMGGGMHSAQQLCEVRDALETEILLGYGQTEAGNFVSYHTLSEQLTRPDSCGRALIHLDVMIADDNRQPVGPGEPGELMLRGPSVLQRYWNQPEASARTLRGGWLATGDLFAMDDEGYLTMLGRLKDLIKSGGENVYPKEVEQVLDAHPAIAECCVFGVADDRWGEAVKAAIVLKSGERLTGEQVADWCRDHIAGYKRPRYVEFMDALPRSEAGKLLMRDIKARAVTPDQAVP